MFHDTFTYNLTFSLKGTVSVILSDPPCNKGNARFTTVPLKPLTVLRVERAVKGSDRLCIVVELSMQYCGQNI